MASFSASTPADSASKKRESVESVFSTTSGASRKSGASFGSDASYAFEADSEDETPQKAAYDGEAALEEALKESKLAAECDRIARELGDVSLGEETAEATTPEEIAASKAALSEDVASEAASEEAASEAASEASAPASDVSEVSVGDEPRAPLAPSNVGRAPAHLGKGNKMCMKLDRAPLENPLEN